MAPDEQTEGAEDGERREPLSPAPVSSPPSNEPPRDETRTFRRRLWGCFRTGALVNAYSCIATLGAIDLTDREVTILAVMGLTVVQRMLDEFGVTRVLARVFFPLLWLMGLPRKAAFLWIVVQTLGLAYGAAVIIERAVLRRATVCGGPSSRGPRSRPPTKMDSRCPTEPQASRLVRSSCAADTGAVFSPVRATRDEGAHRGRSPKGRSAS